MVPKYKRGGKDKVANPVFEKMEDFKEMKKDLCSILGLLERRVELLTMWSRYKVFLKVL